MDWTVVELLFVVVGTNSSEDDKPGEGGWVLGDAAELSLGRFMDAISREDLRGAEHRKHQLRLSSLAHQLPFE